MRIVGYSDRLSAQPGETIRFMVSCELPSYRADIVRLIHGDLNPKGPGFKEEPVPTSVSGDFPGRVQSINSGSYVEVPDSSHLRCTAGFTIQAWIYPTTPQKGLQGILTKWSDHEEVGYGIFIDEDGGLALWTGDGSGPVEKVRTGRAMRASEWYFVAATYDAPTGKVWLYQEPLADWPLDDSRTAVEERVPAHSVGESEVAFLMAGYWQRTDRGNAVVTGHFNGKIDSPRLYAAPLDASDIDSLRQGKPAGDVGDGLVAAWDFSADISSRKVTDTSLHGLHGRTVNMPARAMTGHNWTGHHIDFKRAPDEYGAIHFHDTDLEDAGWEADFDLVVPDELRSGVYAARLKSGDDEDYIPFFVRPRKGAPSASILFLAPTLTYMAYANEQVMNDPALLEPFDLDPGAYPKAPQDKYAVDNRLLSLYDGHTDGSGVCYSSRLRPIVNMRPKYDMPMLANGQGSPEGLNADLHLVDWLEAKGHGYDVVTDEDLHFEGLDLLAPYKVVLTGCHPEYWTAQMLEALEEYLSNGGRLMYLGGNGFYWVTSVDPERPHIIEVRRWRGSQTWEAGPGEYYHSTTGEVGGLWRFRGRAPQKLVGVGVTAQGIDRNVPYEREPGSFDPRAAFIFDGVGKEELIGDFDCLVMEYGAAGFEIDRLDYTLGSPPHTLLLATSSSRYSDSYQHVKEEVLAMDPMQGGPINPLVRADMVYFEGPKGGAVFSVGSISWCGSLGVSGYDNNVSRITDNVLTRFASDEPIS